MSDYHHYICSFGLGGILTIQLEMILVNILYDVMFIDPSCRH